MRSWETIGENCLKRLDPEFVKQRDTGQTNRQTGEKITLSYIEGWKALEEANRIFGHGSWSRETTLIPLGEPYEATNKWGKKLWHVDYAAKVRITVDLGVGSPVIRDGCGFGSGINSDRGAAYEGAMKEAETDATKRALVTFGNPFGLELYDKDRLKHIAEEAEPQDAWDKVPEPATGISPHDFKREPGENSSAMGGRDLDLLKPEMMKCRTETELTEWWKGHSDVIIELNTDLRWGFFTTMIMRGLDLCTNGTRLETFWNKHEKALKVLKKADEKAGTHKFTALEDYKVERFAQLAQAEDYEIKASLTPLDAG